MRNYYFRKGLLLAFLAILLPGTMLAQVPVEVSPDSPNYEYSKEQWIKSNPQEYSQMKLASENSAQKLKSTQKAQQPSQDDLEKAAWIKENTELYKAQVEAMQPGQKPVQAQPSPSSNQGSLIPVAAKNASASEYESAKTKWVKENPAAYQQLKDQK